MSMLLISLMSLDCHSRLLLTSYFDGCLNPHLMGPSVLVISVQVALTVLAGPEGLCTRVTGMHPSIHLIQCGKIQPCSHQILLTGYVICQCTSCPLNTAVHKELQHKMQQVSLVC